MIAVVSDLVSNEGRIRDDGGICKAVSRNVTVCIPTGKSQTTEN